MSERLRPTAPAWSLERDALELEAESRACEIRQERAAIRTVAAIIAATVIAACEIPQERAAIRTALREIHTAMRERERQQEELALLPEVWQAIHGDVSQAAAFLALFSGLRTAPEAKLTATRQAFFAWPAETPAALEWIAQEAAGGRELYQCGHLVTQPRRRKADAASLTSLWVDLDHDAMPAHFPQPTVVVESSPGRLQCYWRLITPVSPDQGELLNRRLAHTVGADPSGYDLTQLLRIPFTQNHKYPEWPTVQLLTLTATVHDPDELAQHLVDLPPSNQEDTPAHASAALPEVASDGAPPVPLPPAAMPLWAGLDVKRTPDGRVDRSASLVRIARILADRGVTPDAIVTALAERDAALGWRKYSDRLDAWNQYEKIADLLEP